MEFLMTEYHRTPVTPEVSPDGHTITLGFFDSDGRSMAMRFPINQAEALAMTLPVLIETALQRQFNDASLCFTYPLQSWRCHATSDASTNILTLTTVDGFSVSFSLLQQQSKNLSETLADVQWRARPVEH
jgi:hypothetical protein